MMGMLQLYIALILLLPVIGAIFHFFTGNKSLMGWLVFGFSFLVFIVCVLLYMQWNTPVYQNFDWFEVGSFTFQIGFLLDKLSVIMLIVVSLVTLLVNVFSIEYMKNDEGKNRYFAFLGLFAFSMYGIILSSNLFLTFCFWELVGFASYLLIGFWYRKSEPPKASFKVFMVNRVGDVGFLVALFILFTYFKTFDLPILYEQFSIDNLLLTINHFPLSTSLLTVLGLGLFLGATGKSAQFPLQIWLPDAMSGPTPVSALIHAATMVAAGVFMLIRVFPMLSEQVLIIIAFSGAITAFMGAFAAFNQNDIKKILAFSTISQLGYMMIAIGSGSPDVAFFHLITHAFFKAGLFLCAGSIIHTLHEQFYNVKNFDTQNMLNMGGLKKKMPYTFIAYTISMQALCGMPFFSGYFSKEAVITSAIQGTDGGVQIVIPILAVVSAFMTAAYMGRQYFMIFFGKMKNEISSFCWYESKLMVVPIFILSLLSIWFWYGINPFGTGGEWLTDDLLFYQKLTPPIHQWWISILLISLIIIGFLSAYYSYIKAPQNQKTPFLLFRTKGVQYLKNLSFNHWYLDKIYSLIIIKPVLSLSGLSALFDRKVIDGAVDCFGIINVILAKLSDWFDRNIVDGIVILLTKIFVRTGNMTRSIQGGKVQMYYVWAIVGIVLIFIFVLL